jgi:CHAD domain-containing protein
MTSERTSGAYAHALLQRHCRRLVELHGPVLANDGTEPLHQMRVSLRRLRSCLGQFGPCLRLPAAVDDSRLAKSVRRLGLARDLDVLQERLDEGLLPQLPEQERQRLKPVRRQLTRERTLAQEHLEKTLQSSRHLELIAELQGWLRQPAYSPLGEQPLHQWLPEWCLPGSASLMLHPGWWLRSPEENVDTLHDLRKRIKTVRYQLENLQELLDSRGRQWISQLKEGQSLLGELNDLSVLRKAIDDQLGSELDDAVPQLGWLLEQHRQHCWNRWIDLSRPITDRRERRRRLAGLLRWRSEGSHWGRLRHVLPVRHALIDKRTPLG